MASQNGINVATQNVTPNAKVATPEGGVVGKPNRVSAEQFITTWQTSESTQEVAKKLNLSENNVKSRYKTYVGKKINLKEMPKTRRGIDVKALNTLIKSLPTQTEGATA